MWLGDDQALARRARRLRIIRAMPEPIKAKPMTASQFDRLLPVRASSRTGGAVLLTVVGGAGGNVAFTIEVGTPM